MKLDIITGPRASGKTTKLRQLTEAYKNDGKEVLELFPNSTLAYIRRKIVLASLQGYAAVTLDDCRPETLKRLRRAIREIGERMDINLTIHVVEAA
ncbi:hypothetical protein D3C84_773090 [compost metagenome]